MRHQYRVTKYDPALRTADGAYRKEEWTSWSDIDRTFAGVRLTEKKYLKTEASYLLAVSLFLREAKLTSLALRGLECAEDVRLPRFIKEDATLSIAQCVEFSRLALREVVWGKLVIPGRAYVHFGYDYYLYVGLPVHCPDALAEVEKLGLFVEPFRSPCLRERS